MNLNLHRLRRSAVVLAALILLGRPGLNARAEDAASPKPAAVTNTLASTNTADVADDEAEKAWKLVYRATQRPMPPPEWSTKPPTQEEVEKFNLDTLHKGMDLARDFYTKYPNHPKVATAQKAEYEMVQIAATQFHDTNLAPRLAALEKKRMTDPNLSDDDKFAMRVDPLEMLLRGLPDTADELDKRVHELQKDFPKRPDVYKVMMMVMQRSEGARADAWAKEILDSPAAPDEIKISVKLEQRGMVLQKLIAGLPATADELDKNARLLPKDFPDRQEAYGMMLFVLARMDATHQESLAKFISDGNAPDSIKSRVKGVLRIATLEKLIAKFPATLDEFLKGVHELEAEQPQSAGPYQLMVVAFDKSTGDSARKLGAELLDSPIDAKMKSQISGMLKQMEKIGKPVDIKYTAVDGREVDLAKMKGKVVLVDFWGTWCPSCMQEIPHVKSTFAKLHDKGFEILGIDCNDPKATFLRTLKAQEMTWPQYYQDDTGPNKFADQYGVHLFPTMWLIDKQGIVRDVNGMDSLEEKVTKLLAE